ncbi:hypothetical protein NDK25_24350 [Niallia taxi]|nr:hypothetical protein [Niallia taxi]MDE5055353.1 hypothetical protein [Niallia taxi]
MLATALIASTFAFSNTSYANAQDGSETPVTNEETNEVYADFDYEDIKDIPSTVDINISSNTPTKPGEISTMAQKPIAFGNGSTYINQDGLYWYGTHATSISKGKMIFQFAVYGDLYKKKKGTSKLTLLNSDDELFTGKQSGIAMVNTRGKTGVAGDTMIAKSKHYVHIGIATSEAETKAEKNYNL